MWAYLLRKESSAPKCRYCGRRNVSLDEVKNARGTSIAVACADCHAKFNKEIVQVIDSMHGAYIVDGQYLCSPKGTPDYRSVAAGPGGKVMIVAPDMMPCEVDLGKIRYTCTPINPAPLPYGGRLVAAKILSRHIDLPGRYFELAREFGIPRTHYVFRISVIENAAGERSAQAEYMVIESGCKDKIFASFEPLKSHIEDFPFSGVNQAAQEMWNKYKHKSLFDWRPAA